MGLATNVLRKCALDLFFFSIVFIVSMLAFSSMFYIQLGPVMEDYWDQFAAFINIFRALFGDFDIDEINANSSGYLNCILFLGYAFVAIFIMLSMFLAILAEGQTAVRGDEERREEEEAAGGPVYKQFGIFEDLGEIMLDVKEKVFPSKKKKKKKNVVEEEEKDVSAKGEAEAEQDGVSNTQLLEAIKRLHETTQALQAGLDRSNEENRQLQSEVAALRQAPVTLPVVTVTVDKSGDAPRAAAEAPAQTSQKQLPARSASPSRPSSRNGAPMQPVQALPPPPMDVSPQEEPPRFSSGQNTYTV